MARGTGSGGIKREFRRLLSIEPDHNDAGHTEHQKWGWRYIRWNMVFWYQDWAIVLVALIAIGLFVREQIVGYPVERSVMLYDATISLPRVKSRTVPSWQAALIPLALMFATLAWMEFSLFSFKNSITNVLTVFLHFSISSMAAWTTAVWITSFFKNWAGRLRPDFLARCKPVLPDGRSWLEPEFQFGKMVNITCGAKNLDRVRHGHFSFPSQHSTWAMTAAWYSVLYISWVMHSRASGWMQVTRFRSTGYWRVARELIAAVAFSFLFCQILFVWIIGVSRFRENRHNISDIVSGWFMGFTISTLYANRAINVYAAIRAEITRKERELDLAESNGSGEPLLHHEPSAVEEGALEGEDSLTR